MADESYSFTQARTRLEEIVSQVRSKDVSLEKSLDLLEEGVRLANICTEQSDHTEWRSVIEGEDTAPDGDASTEDELAEDDSVPNASGESASDTDDSDGESSDEGAEESTPDDSDAPVEEA